MYFYRFPERCAQSATYYGKIVFEGFQRTLKNITVISSSPDNLQRLCNLASSLIEGLGIIFKKQYLPKLKELLEIVALTDFFNLIQFPCNFFYSIKPHLIDENHLLSQLENVFFINLKIEKKSETQKNIKDTLESFLDNLVEEDIHYSTTNDLLNDLKSHFIKEISNWKTFSTSKNINLEEINFHQLNIVLKRKNILETLSKLSFLFYDIGSPINFLGQWGFISLSKIAHSLGRFKLFSWVPKQSLEKWVIGSYGLGFVFQLISACKVIKNKQSTENQKEQAYWDVAVSTTEIFLNSLFILEGSRVFIVFLTSITKTIGIFSLFKRPSIKFFDNNEKNGTL